MSYTLKLKGDMALPGLALPEAFQSLDSRLESVIQLCTAKGSPEAQVVGVVTVCEELKQLLKCTFIENGMLASRIEILTRYLMESVKKMDKKVNDMDIENKVTRKHMKRLGKKLNAQQVMQKKKDGEWWDMAVRTTDYDSFITLSRAGGYPDLEFMLRVNQLMIDFVSDSSRTELVLPPMGLEERQEVSKLASIYKLRCRYGKSVQIAPSTILKARTACVPAAGEVDAILNNFTRAHIQRKTTEETVTDDKVSTGGKELATNSKDERAKPSSISLPSTMLTPIPNLPSPTIDISSLKQPSHSPPSSALATPTEGATTRFTKQRESAGTSGYGAGSSSSSSSQMDRKHPAATQSGKPSSSGTHGPTKTESSQVRQDNKKGGKTKEPPTQSESHSSSASSSSATATSTTATASSATTSAAATSSASPAVASKSAASQPSQPTPPTSRSSSGPHHPPSPVGIVITPTTAGGSRSPGGGILVQSQIRGLGATHSTVLALPIKCNPPPPSSRSPQPQPRSLRKEKEKEEKGDEIKKRGERGKEGEEVSRDEGNGGGGGGGGGGSARTDIMGPPVKRARVTRRSVVEEEQARQ